MEKEQPFLVFTQLTINEEASLSGGDIFVRGGSAVGGSVGVGESSVSAASVPGIVTSVPFSEFKDLEKLIFKTKD